MNRLQLPEALAINYRRTNELVPYARNSRTHSDEQISKLMNSIREFGFTNPILVDGENGIIAGHGRFMAANRLGLETVPVIELSHLSEDQRRAYVIADNRLAEDAGWDEELLKLELGALAELDFDLTLTGFNSEDLAEILHGVKRAGLTDENAAPPLTEVTVSVIGDLWVLGEHRVICGDCTVPETVSRLLAGCKPNLMVTDPPYGVNYDASWRSKLADSDHAEFATGKVLNDHRADWREAWDLFPGNVAYVWHAGTQAHVVADSLIACRFQIRSQIAWVKQRHVLSRGHYHAQHEPCYQAERIGGGDGEAADEHELAAYAVRQDKTAGWVGGRKQSTVWFIEHIKNDTGHSTQKPVECMRRPIENNSNIGQAIYDPFLGSGTTLISAETSGRICYGSELNPAYVDIIVKRWQDFSGHTATLDGDGRSFDEIARLRLAHE